MIHTVLCMIYLNGVRRHIHFFFLQMYYFCIIFKYIHFNYPSYLHQNLILYSSSYHLRLSANNIFSPLVKKVFGKKSFRYKAPADWNNLSLKVRSLTSFDMFKKQVCFLVLKLLVIALDDILRFIFICAR